MTKQQWKEYLSSIGWVDTSLENPKDERIIRKAVSELRKEGIILIPLSAHYYIDVNRCSREDATVFAESQMKAWKTQYFNTVLPLKKFIGEQRFKELMGTLV